MSRITHWRRKIRDRQEKDTALEHKSRIQTNTPKNWVSSADIEALEEQMVPWLRNKRRR